MSYLQLKVKVDATLEYRVVGPSDTAPTPAQGYQIDPTPITIPNVPGKWWIEFRVILA